MFEAIEENLRFLADETGVHVHADLIAGLPGEDLESFGAGFDRLHALGVSEIQLGILKRLRGTPITHAGEEWGMVYSPQAPYEVLRTSHLSFQELQGLQRFSRYWDLVVNSGRFRSLSGALLSGDSVFGEFQQFSEWLWNETRETAGISVKRLGRFLVRYLVERKGMAAEEAGGFLNADRKASRRISGGLPERQARHVTVRG